MSNTWILVASRSNARLFTNHGSHKTLTLLQDIAHSEGRLKDSELGSDQPGRAFDSGGQGRHAMGKSESPSEHEAASFARELAGLLHKGRVENEYASLVLVAEPHFLGLLNAALDDHTAKLVTETVKKDYGHTPDDDLPDLLLQHVKL